MHNTTKSVIFLVAALLIPANVQADEAAPLPDEAGCCDVGDEPVENNLCKGDLVSGKSFKMDQIIPLVVGNWSQVAHGTNWTRGVNQDIATIYQDKVSRRLMIKGQGNPIQLKPIHTASIASGMDYTTLGKMKIKFEETGVEDGVPFKLEMKDTTGDEILEIYDCAPTQTPMFWWQANMDDGKKSYGMLVFLSQNAAIGHMGNNAGGSRSVWMYR